MSPRHHINVAMDEAGDATSSLSPTDSEPDEDEKAQALSEPLQTEGQEQESRAPGLLHRFRHNASILCLTACDERVFAGTQAGEILVSGMAPRALSTH